MKKAVRHLGLAMIIGGLILTVIPLLRYAQGVYYQRLQQAAMVGEPPVVEDAAPPPLVSEPLDELPEAEIDPDQLPPLKGILEVPKIKLDVVVAHGVSDNELKRGPGFYPQSRHPEHGNVSIAAHRAGYAGWFLRVNQLNPGDEIFLTLGEKRYRYQVREQYVTHNRDWDVVLLSDGPELTFTTCLITSNEKRLIVKSDLVDVLPAKQPQALEWQ